MRKTALLALSLLSFQAQAADSQQLVPKHWKVLQKAEGDLNKDGLKDIVLIVSDTNPKNVIKNDALGSPELNINPRHLIIAFKNNAGGYDLKLTQKSFIPTEGSEESPCLEDPLTESKAMSIRNGVLRIQLSYWSSCGSWMTGHNTYAFRYDNGQFDLIGYDTWEMHRASGEITESSTNFLTGKRSRTTGGSIEDDGKNKSHLKTIWEKVNFKKHITLDNIRDDDLNDIDQ